MQSLRCDLVQPRLFDERLARGLDVQILVHIVGALDVGIGDPLILVVGSAAGGVGVLERFVRAGLEFSFALIGRGYFGHVHFLLVCFEDYFCYFGIRW